MNLWVSMIALNEQKYIKSALKSCSFIGNTKDHFDGIAIVDGGSSDKTLTTIRRYQNTKWDVETWNNDFGTQRQRSLELVPGHADWWMRLDADETYSKIFQLNIREMLESLPEEVVCVRIRQVNLYPDSKHYSAGRGGWETWPRIFRNLRLPDGEPAWIWTGKVHEYPRLMTRNGLIDITEGESIVNWNVPVVHWGWIDSKRREDREKLYVSIPGSGFQTGSLVERTHVIKEVVSL